MDTFETGLIKHREIAFNELHADPNQARSAALLLADLEGVLAVTPLAPTLMRISYDLMRVTLEQLEGLLSEAGFHLDNRLLYKLARALYYYSEETERANNGCGQGNSNCTQRVFVNRYLRQNHECRDQRPKHWRKYL